MNLKQELQEIAITMPIYFIFFIVLDAFLSVWNSGDVLVGTGIAVVASYLGATLIFRTMKKRLLARSR